MSGNLYQLKTNAPEGAVVIIGGPHDTYGFVIKRKPSGYHLIRGTGHQKPQIQGTIYDTESQS
jgi:hypothetical protein